MKTVYGLLSILFLCASATVKAAPLENNAVKNNTSTVTATASITQKGKKPMHHKKHHKRRKHHAPVHHK